jgi:hypothetical protein
MWCRGRVQFIEEETHGLSLFTGPFENGRSAPDGGILFFDLGRPPSGDERRNERLDRERNEVVVVEEAREEVVYFGDLGLSA